MENKVTWKTKDGYITYDFSLKCFSYFGESAVDAYHKFNQIRRSYNLTMEQNDTMVIQALNNRLEKITTNQPQG